MTDRIIASFDPGVSTGVLVASVSFDERDNVQGLPTIVDAVTIEWPDRFEAYDALFYLLEHSQVPVHLLILEDFHLCPHAAAPKIGSGFPEIRSIGYIEAFAWGAGLGDRLLWQQPSNQMKSLPDDWTQQLRGQRHVLSAAYHFRYWWLLSQKNKYPKQNSRTGYWSWA